MAMPIIGISKRRPHFKLKLKNSEMKFCENYEVEKLKIIIIIIGYTLNNFTTLFTIL